MQSQTQATLRLARGLGPALGWHGSDSEGHARGGKTSASIAKRKPAGRSNYSKTPNESK